MNEHFIIYSLETGDELWRGSGPQGAAAVQVLLEGTGIALVPQEALLTRETNLDIFKAALVTQIDNEAERVRCRFATGLPLQVGAYWMKAEVARRWLADNNSPTVMLMSEAKARDMTIAELATEVVSKADVWMVIADEIEGIRFTAKRAIAEATTVGNIAKAAVVDWSEVGNNANNSK